MRVVVKKQNVHLILSMEEKAKLLASGRWKQEAMRGVIDAGRRTTTQVKRAVHTQMATRSKAFVNSGTRTRIRQSEMAFDIFALPGGQRIEEYKGLQALVPSGAAARRMNAGRSGSDAGTVRSGVWNAPRIFKRSFAANGGFFALLPKGQSKVAPRMLWTYGNKPGQPRDAAGKFTSRGILYGKIRRLYGPSLRNELGEGETLATFHREGSKFLLEKVMQRMEKILNG